MAGLTEPQARACVLGDSCKVVDGNGTHQTNLGTILLPNVEAIPNGVASFVKQGSSAEHRLVSITDSHQHDWRQFSGF